MRYIPELDGLRAVAVMLVMAFHSQAPIISGGFLGVDVFFALSGFLITGILLREIDGIGKIQYRRFYLNRFARLTPPLLLLLALYLLIAPTLWPDYSGHLRDAMLSAAYLSDFSKVFLGAPDMLRHTWSLSVEEHFYILWPLILAPLARLPKQRLVMVMAAAYTIATIWRSVLLGNGDSWDSVYYRFDARLSGLIFGCLLAAAVRAYPQIKTRPVALLVAVILLSLAMQLMSWHDIESLPLGVICAELATGLAIISALNGSKHVALLRNPVLTHLGKLSYGMYLFHYPAMLYLREQYEWTLALPIGTIFALAMAALSYHTIEAAVRRWRHRPAQEASNTPPSPNLNPPAGTHPSLPN